MNEPFYVKLKCQYCGYEFTTSYPGSPDHLVWVQCPNCRQLTPSLPAPTKPPFYSWEVYPHLYPEPTWPSRPGPVAARFFSATIVSAGVMLLLLAALFGVLGVGSSTGSYHATIRGEVLYGSTPLQFVDVRLDWPTGNETLTNLSGGFAFTGVPSGEHTLDVISPGYEETQLTLFISPYFTAPPSNISDLTIGMVESNSNATRYLSYSPFSNMETYLTVVYSEAVMEGTGGIVAIIGGSAYIRSKSPPKAVVGGVGAILAPFFPIAIGVSALYTILFEPSLWIAIGAACVASIGTIGILMKHRPLVLDNL